MYLITLIIPIYNAEEYLDNTINYVVNQSIGFENIELILVDDNSTDNSKKIIEKYAKKYNNIVPFYSESNHGFPGFGRNVGLEKSTAEYIMFMDNDDEIDPNMCENLYNTIKNENADIVCSNFIMIDNISGEIKGNINYINGIENNGQIIFENEDDIILFRSSPVWNKIFKKTIITKNNIRFKENTYADDFIFTISYLLRSKKLVYLKNYFGYRWNLRSSSLSHTVKTEHIELLISSSRYILNMLQKENKDYLSNKLFKDNIPYWFVKCSYSDANKKEMNKILRDIHDFETEINLKKLDGHWDNTINYFVLHENYFTARILLKITNKIRKFEILRKIYRKIIN